MAGLPLIPRQNDPMAVEAPIDLVDWAILAALQDNARQSVAELARLVNLSASAVSERVKRLESSGVIAGYAARIDPERAGFAIMALVRLRYPHGNYKPLYDHLDASPQIIEAHHVTGEDCFVLKVLASSMSDLEQLTGKISTLGAVTTSVVYSSPLSGRAITPAKGR
jgi:Lrp/AsnC family leucine-responsive transcriptional regulator